MNETTKQRIKLDYQLIEFEPEDIELRINRAFDVLFEEMFKIWQSD